MDTPYQQSKHRLLCGSCTAATFMFWDWLDLDDTPHGLSEDRAAGVAYLVRCDDFRLTVQSPHALQKCEGYQAKSARHATDGAA